MRPSSARYVDMEVGDGLVEQPSSSPPPPGPNPTPATTSQHPTVGPEPTWTVDEAIDEIGFGPFQLVMLCVTGLAWMGDAMEMMLLSFLGPAARCEWGISPRQEGMLTSVVFVGMLFGAPTWGQIADWKGRKFAFFCTTLWIFVAGLASSFAGSFDELCAWRAIVGFGLGGVPVAFSVFMEFLPSGNRGVWLTIIETFWTLGSVAAAGLAWAVLPHHSWRLLLQLSTAPLALLLLLIPFVSESPYHSAAVGDYATAKATLTRMAKANAPRNQPVALPKGTLVSPLVFQSSVARDEGAGRFERFVATASKPFRRIATLLERGQRKQTLMLWFIFFAVAFSYYGVVLLTTEVHVDSNAARGDGRKGGTRGGDDAVACTGHGSPDLNYGAYRDIFVSSTAELPGLVLAALSVDLIGRRNSLSSSMALNVVPLLALLGYATFPIWLETLALFLSRAASMWAFTVLYIYAPETVNTSVRATAMGMGNAVARLGGMLCPLFAVEMVESGRMTGAIAFFAALACVTSTVAFFLPIETAGKRLDQVDETGEERHGDVELTYGATEPTNKK